jgi:hypothetical protein
MQTQQSPKALAVVVQRNWRLFALIALAQCADLVTFLAGVERVGLGAEQNALVRHLYADIGPAGPVAMKALTIAAVLGMMSWIAVRHPGRTTLPAAIAIGVGLFGVWGNIVFGLAA